MRKGMKQILAVVGIFLCLAAFYLVGQLGPLTLDNFLWIVVPAVLSLLSIGAVLLVPLMQWGRKGAWDIVVDVKGVRSSNSGEAEEGVTWLRLSRVAILASEAGPRAAGLYLVLFEGEKEACFVPLREPRGLELLDLLQRLPGWDDSALEKVSRKAGPGYFICWEGRRGSAAHLASWVEFGAR
jgi:hypothetical protein